ncbi:hypothetical protein ABIB94_003926 [Bradyrhizobium sp. JR7.2]|jgi:hypothetical protein|nr:hypothetical protein [Bradyrhizobium elkanii]MCS3969032.1 hypothetical protein [Bradyrhizobium japonicum]
MQQGGQSLSSYQWPTLQSRVAYFGSTRMLAWFPSAVA